MSGEGWALLYQAQWVLGDESCSQDQGVQCSVEGEEGGSMKFTQQQLRDWKMYERVRLSGRYNMFDPRARKMSGLDSEAYQFTLSNYVELRDAVKQLKEPSRTPRNLKEKS